MGEGVDAAAPAARLTRPLRVSVLCSYQAPGLVRLLNHDRRRGSSYDVVCCLTSNDTFLEEVLVERRGIPCLAHPIRRFCHGRGVSIRDLDARAAYDAATLERLAPFSPDLLLLDGYLLRLTPRMLDAFAGRIVNVHHSDLALRATDGRVRYPGLRAVRDALVAGERETRASAHIVTEDLDEGPLLVRSWRFPAPDVLRGGAETTDPSRRAAIREHELRMLREAWAPMMAATLGLVAAAIEDVRAPLDPARIGRWLLGPDGTLERDTAAVREMAGV